MTTRSASSRHGANIVELSPGHPWRPVDLEKMQLVMVLDAFRWWIFIGF
jgi:hypothetical protein